jgi:arylsulfatase A-like enzyme
VLGAAAAAWLALCEIAYVAMVSRDAFASGADVARFAGFGAGLLLLAGVVLGVLLGFVHAALGALADRLARRRSTAPIWSARLYTIAATPALAWLAALTFQGRRARTLPHKDLIAVAIGVVAIGCFYIAARIIVRVKDRIGRNATSRPVSVLIGVAMLCVAFALYVADQRILPRLYPFMHAAFAAGAFIAAQLGLGAMYLAMRKGRHGLARLADPQAALLVAVGSVAVGLYAIGPLCKSEALRFVAFDRAALVGKTLAAAGRMHLLPVRAHTTAAPTVDSPAMVAAAGPKLPGADVFLISIDALRADHVGSHGYSRATTPNIDALAKNAVVFERAYSQVPHTSFSLATLLTGKYVYSLAALGDAARHETLAEILRRYRYKTAAFYPPSVFFIDEKKFTTYQESNFGFEYVKFEYLDADKRVDQIVTFLETEKPARTFVWVHFFEPHEPYDVHPGISFGSSAIDRYDGEVAYVDRAVGRLIDYIHKNRPGAIIAITADHGEEFGEHGGRYHGTSLYDEQVHVPMIVAAPNVTPRHVSRPVEVVDLPVTLLALIDVTPSARMRGTDLGPWMLSQPVSESLLPPAFAEIETKKMVAENSTKLVCDTSRDFCELYDLAADPGERHNLIGSRTADAQALHARLDGWLASHSRLEHETDFSGLSANARRALERGRLGDAGAIPELAELLKSPDPKVRTEAAHLLARLPPDPRVKEALLKATKDDAAGDWARVAYERFCDPKNVAALLDGPDHGAEWKAIRALASAKCGSSNLPLIEQGLRVEDVALRKQLFLALGDTRDPKAVELLLANIGTVLERAEVVEALGKTGSAAATPELSRVLREDPYVHVRAQAAHALARVEGRRALPTLRAALAKEKEEPVRAALLAELDRLKSS